MDITRKIHVRVPATTANFGWGYDVMGGALSMYLDVAVTPSETTTVTLTGEGAEVLARDSTNLILSTCASVCAEFGKPMPPMRWDVKSEIPFGCGCGSSSAATVAGVTVALAVVGAAVDPRDVLRRTAAIEGHPDNAAPAILGGIQIVPATSPKESGNDVEMDAKEGKERRDRKAAGELPPTPTSFSLAPPAFLATTRVVLFVPDAKMKGDTHAMRALVPSTVKMSDAVHAMGHVAMLTWALARGDLKDVAEIGWEERLHQERRGAAMYPHLRPAVRAARRQGAEFAFLSGAGPTVCALVQRGDADGVGAAMKEAAKTAGVAGRIIVTKFAERGAEML